VQETPTSTPRPDTLEQRIGQVCDAIGAFIEYWGFKAIHGRIWGLLALRNSPMTQAQVAKTLGVSRALVSSAMAELTDYGLVRATSPARNTPYEAVMDIWPTISDVLRSREWMLLEAARLALEAALEEVGLARASGRTVPYSPDRLRFLLTMTDLSQTLLKMLIALRAPRSVDGLRTWATRATAFIQGFRRVI
jgi:DNA-binding transcriptional regulator GbsR (MarR family)